MRLALCISLVILSSSLTANAAFAYLIKQQDQQLAAYSTQSIRVPVQILGAIK